MAGSGASDAAAANTAMAANARPFEAPAVPEWAQSDNTRKPWTRWWWPGSAVDKDSLTSQLEEFARVGIGGVEITPIYGAFGYEDRYIDFLTPEFMEMLEHVGREGERLGIGIDMATGTGWPFGGPWVEEGDALLRAALDDNGALTGVPTGMQVKRAAPGDEGPVVNPFSASALSRYFEPFTAAFQNFPNDLIRSQFHDSFEYYDASWAPEFTQAFGSLHGYDVQEYAAAIMGEEEIDRDTLGRIKSDFRQTLDALHKDYIAEWKRWSHEHGFIIRNQSHGAPANLLDLYAMVDIPETEVFGSTPYPIPGLRRDDAAVRHDQSLPEPLVTRMASSASHVMGHPLTSSESATWLRDHWKVTLAHIKPELDRILLDGINHIFYHGTVFSPDDASWPGWLFYASTQFNPNNPWWDDFSELNAYVERVQTVLQRGRPDNRVLLYWPIYDLWDNANGLMQQLTVHDVGFIMESRTGELARELDDDGYAFDYISDEQLALTTISDGRLVTPGSDYDVIVVPAADHMPLETLQALIGLAESGASIVFDGLPADVPGFGNLDQRRSEFQSLLDQLELAAPAAVAGSRQALGSGAVFRGDVLAALESIGTTREGFALTPVDFIRRRTAAGYDYFLVNLEDELLAGWVPLGVPVEAAEIIDPLTGQRGVATIRADDNGATSIWLQLKPGESLLVSTHDSQSGEALSGMPQWSWLEPEQAIPVEGTWSVEFIEGGPELPASITMPALESWTEAGDDEARRFAGTARYRIEFEAPESVDSDVAGWLLSLGDVRESARVRLNGQDIGTVWSLPFEIEIGDALQPGSNVLEVEVTNVAANRIRDMDQRGVEWKIMREINFVNIRYQPFDASDWPLELSGLLGPVELVPMTSVR